jgi:hypothetical protein
VGGAGRWQRRHPHSSLLMNTSRLYYTPFSYPAPLRAQRRLLNSGTHPHTPSGERPIAAELQFPDPPSPSPSSSSYPAAHINLQRRRRRVRSVQGQRGVDRQSRGGGGSHAKGGMAAVVRQPRGEGARRVFDELHAKGGQGLHFSHHTARRCVGAGGCGGERRFEST